MEVVVRKAIRRRRSKTLPLIVGIVLLALGLAGQTGAALGYGLLLVSVLLLAGGLKSLVFLVFSKTLSFKWLTGMMKWLFLSGAWTYVLGVCSLSGFYIFETMQGRMELKWILFGPLALAALVVFDWGIYRVLYKKNRPSWERYRQFVTHENADQESMRKTFFSDVVFHTSLRSTSGFRWLRHTLILWGFVLMFAVEVVAVFVREGLPAFGFTDVWEISSHPVRLAFDFAFDFFGAMVLVGCVLAIVWRITVNQKEEKKFADTPSAVFLLIVVLSGFLVEGMRIAAEGMPAGSGFSFAGVVFAWMLPGGEFAEIAYNPLWYFHVFGSLLFIAYIPGHRLVHSCATPLGRLMNSQKKMLVKKRLASLQGLAGVRTLSQKDISGAS